ncbi:hypothetical protein FHS54_001238 [Sphingobium vermicomposti]|uniref:Uncharacterized protein n=1 Tax=Sphingobium vermicomposti TaxID=529005 RepID=A0A846M2X6_9SPHN|nr:hypothetical protein [Sphingobium vermicomposti]
MHEPDTDRNDFPDNPIQLREMVTDRADCDDAAERRRRSWRRATNGRTTSFRHSRHRPQERT